MDIVIYFIGFVIAYIITSMMIISQNKKLKTWNLDGLDYFVIIIASGFSWITLMLFIFTIPAKLLNKVMNK